MLAVPGAAVLLLRRAGILSMLSPTGVIPESLMDPSKKADVVRWLTAQPFEGNLKRRLLEGWAITVGIRVRGRDYKMVEASGIDYAG